MRFQDWREVPPGVVQPLYAAERARWAGALGWDLQPTLQIVETARVRGELPGMLAWDGAAVVGWSFYVVAAGTLQIGSLVAQRASTVRSLLNAIWDSPEALATTSLSCFVLPSGSALRCALARQRFDVRPQHYLSRDLEGHIAGKPLPASLVAGTWTCADPEIVRLLARCYAGTPAGRCFAPSGTFEQWVHYLHQLLCTPVCGVLQPAASFVVRRADTGRPMGLALTTMIGDGTSHIAQVVVDPECRRMGLGAWLVQRACEASRLAGARRATLIVGDDNGAAKSLYASLGFTAGAEFLFAARSRPLRRTRSFLEHVA